MNSALYWLRENECSDIDDSVRNRSIENFLNFRRIKLNIILENNIIKKFNFTFEKIIFIKIQNYINFIKNLKNLFNILFILKIWFTKNKNIIKINNNEFIDEWYKNMIYISLKSYKYIYEIEKYYISLKIIIAHEKYYL